IRDRREIVGNKPINGSQGRWTNHAKLAHVGNIEHTHAFADGIVFRFDAGILDRQLEPSKIHNASTQAKVFLIERRASRGCRHYRLRYPDLRTNTIPIAVRPAVRPRASLEDFASVFKRPVRVSAGSFPTFLGCEALDYRGRSDVDDLDASLVVVPDCFDSENTTLAVAAHMYWREQL